MTSKDFSFPPTHPEEYSSLRWSSCGRRTPPLIKGEPSYFWDDVMPYGCHGRLGTFVKRLFSTVVKPCGNVLNSLHVKSPHHHRNKRQPKRDWEVTTCGWLLPAPINVYDD
jgi:hypothetical protein